MRSLISLGKRRLYNVLAKNGRRVTRSPLGKYLQDFKIDCVLDVGANIGQYAIQLRELGYRGRIESFEPLPEIFKQLQTASHADTLWHAHPYALGSENCILPINVSANSPSSSFLQVDDHIAANQVNLSTLNTVDASIKRLDDVYNQIVVDAKHIYLKIDTQGFERNVIEGGIKSLAQISLVQMELALVANYQGETLIEEMMQLMRGNGFVPWWILDGFRNPTSLQLYQADVFFVRRDLSELVRS